MSTILSCIIITTIIGIITYGIGFFNSETEDLPPIALGTVNAIFEMLDIWMALGIDYLFVWFCRLIILELFGFAMPTAAISIFVLLLIYLRTWRVLDFDYQRSSMFFTAIGAFAILALLIRAGHWL